MTSREILAHCYFFETQIGWSWKFYVLCKGLRNLCTKYYRKSHIIYRKIGQISLCLNDVKKLSWESAKRVIMC